MKFKRIEICYLLLILLIFLIITGYKKMPNWEASLYTPTMIQKIDDTYFIVDCHHHRIIYNDNLTDEISKWNTLTKDIKGGHSIASDGELYIIDDTDNAMLKIFIKYKNKFQQKQIIENITGRPHYVAYDDDTKCFYVIASLEQKIYTIGNMSGKAIITDVKTIPELGSYVRSFNLIDGYMYTVSGSSILKIDYKNGFSILKSYSVPDELIGMNHIAKIGQYFYISSYTNASGEKKPDFVRIKDLTNLVDGEYETLYNTFGFEGTPYYISYFDNKYFITEIDASSGVKSFNVKNDKISNIKTYYYFKGHSQASQERRDSKIQ